jgi:hypothetical protein
MEQVAGRVQARQLILATERPAVPQRDVLKH